MDILKLHDSVYGSESDIRDAVGELEKFVASAGMFNETSLIPATKPITPQLADSNKEEVGAMPSSSTTSDGKVEPEGTPMPVAVMEKIQTEKQARFLNLFFHVLWNSSADSEEPAKKAKLQDAHTALAEKMAEKGWQHPYLDTLDDTLPPHLSTTVGIISPAESPQISDGRVPITVGIADTDGKLEGKKDDLKAEKKNDRFVATLPELQLGLGYSKLTRDEALKLVGDSLEPETELPQDALYLLIDVVEEGIFNNVEVTKAEMEAAAPDYAGRMFIEGHDWNDPQKAIGQVLKASVYFNKIRNKWTMRALTVVLRKHAIESFTLGLYKFVSIGASMRATCNICGLSLQEGCPHKRGVFYDTPRGKIKCHFIGREMVMEELSAVNVPACRPAGVVGRVSIDRAREMLAASMEGGEAIGSLDFVCSLQEIIYREDKGEVPMSKWQEKFRTGDIKGYMTLLASAEESTTLGHVFQEMRAKRKVDYSNDETLSFAHELLHRWFNTPARCENWTEEEIVAEHDNIVAKMSEMGQEHVGISFMDAALHEQSKFAKCNKCGQEPCSGTDMCNSETVKDAIVSEELEIADCGKGDGKGNKKVAPVVQNINQEQCSKPEKVKANLDSKLLNTDGAAEPENASEQTKVVAGGEIEKEDEQLPEQGKGEAVAESSGTVAVSMNDACERRAGYIDGVAKAQAGGKAGGKEMNQGAGIVKGDDYEAGYQEGYKRPTKGKNHLKEQISKGGIQMVNTGSESPVVAVNNEAENANVELAALKDVGTNEIQGELKAEMQKVDVDNQVDKDKLGDVNVQSSSEQRDASFKTGVKEEKVSKNGADYGYIKCPECGLDNIAVDAKKCPNCGKNVEMKEDKRMGDFPVQKTHSAYDTPPMEAKSQKPSEAPKMKLTAEVALTDELKMVKQHLKHLDERAENERAAWAAERQDFMSERESLVAANQQMSEELESLKLDLQTKDTMYRTVSEENSVLTAKLEKYAQNEKNEVIEQIVQTKIELGLISDEDVDAQRQRYTEQSIDTLKVILTEVAGNTKAIALAKSQTFGVPSETTESLTGNSEKDRVVETGDDAVKLEKEANEHIAKEDKVEKPAGVKTRGNSIMGTILRSLGQ
jgi:F0F1-type ATP synthase delta subunit